MALFRGALCLRKARAAIAGSAAKSLRTLVVPTKSHAIYHAMRHKSCQNKTNLQ